MKRVGLAAAALIALSVAIAGWGSFQADELECPDETCLARALFLYQECDLFVYTPDTHEPIELGDLISQCLAGNDELINSIINCVADFCPECGDISACIDELYGDDDDDTDDDDTDDDDTDDDDADDDDWLDDDGDEDDDSDDLWDDDDDDDDTTAPTPAPKSDDDDDDDPYAMCA